MKRHQLTPLVCLLTVLGLGPVVARAQSPNPPSENPVTNPSFEDLTNQTPTGWHYAEWGGKGRGSVASVGHTGSHSALVSSRDGADVAWGVTVPVQPHSTYRLSGWIKTQDVKPVGSRPGRGALFNLHNIQPVATPPLVGTHDWTRVEVVFETGSQDAVQINCLLGGWGLATGQAWYDDVALELVTGKNWEPTVAIDVSKPGHPISPYIYGQFIEHLGRCIYGGIWAEMLEDRKFYYPVTAHYAPYGEGLKPRGVFPVVAASPWEIVGAADAVRMDKESPFVGEHTPRIAAGSGIRQHDLALVQGKKYVGYVWAKSADTQPTKVSVALGSATGGGTFACDAGQYVRHAFEFTANESTDQATLTISFEDEPGYLGTVSLMPADHVDGLRPDTLALLKQLNSPVYRWPGGNFVSGYDWKDGIGDRDRRPPRKNPAWTGVEHNDFGMDEFIHFCRLLGTEPYIAVNSGLGGVQNAVEELQYANGAASTPMGARRAENGHPEPYGVKFWGVGNEMYGGWQLGHMPLADYVRKHNEFAQALRAEDPSIKLVAVGDAGPWSEGMMRECAENMDLISEHFYRQEAPGLASHVAQIGESVRAKAEAHRRYREQFESLKGKDIDIALDEWNFWYGPHVFGELGTRYFLKDALGIAGGLHEYARQSDIMFMANYAQTVNVIGCIKTTKTAAEMETTGLVLQLYRAHFGTVPVAVQTEAPLDVVAALTEDGKQLTIGVVNPTLRALSIPCQIAGAKLATAGSGQRWQIAGSDPQAFNHPGQPRTVDIQEDSVAVPLDALQVGPCSVTLFKLPLAE